MPGQSHLERDHYEHQVHIEADVEQAQSGFGGEAFRSSWTMARRVRLVATYEISGVLGFINLFIIGSILCPIWALGSLFVAGVSSLGSSNQSRLVTFAPTGFHWRKLRPRVSDFHPNWCARNSSRNCAELAPTLLTPNSRPLSRWSTGPTCPVQKG